MGILQRLKLAREDKNTATDDAGRRRNKLLDKLREQLLIVRMAAKGMQFSWRWESDTISTNLDGIWKTSVEPIAFD